jgi:hypothetical protein
MEHRSAMYALGARQKIHGFTLRKPQSDRLLAERSLQIILVVTTLFVAVFIFVPPATVTVKILGNTEVRRRGTDQ